MSITVQRKSAPELNERMRNALESVDVSFDELAALAARYELTPEELAVWEEVRSIRFLLGDE